MPYVISVGVLVLLEPRLFFIYGVVCQVHTEVVQIRAHRRLVFLCSESCQTLLIDECPQRSDTCDKNIDPQIKFQVVYQIRLVKILLSNIMLPLLKPFISPCQENTISLTIEIWLYYKCFSSFHSELLFKRFSVSREDPCLRKEVIMLWHCFCHQIQVSSKQILARQDFDVW